MNNRSIIAWIILTLAVIGLLAIPLAMCFATGVEQAIVVDRVDAIELNHFYDYQGRIVFDQIIFWRWSYDYLSVPIAYKIVSRQNVREIKLTLGKINSVIYRDGNLIRRVESKIFTETHTQYDRELVARGNKHGR